jgi:hypothetical protein
MKEAGENPAGFCGLSRDETTSYMTGCAPSVVLSQTPLACHRSRSIHDTEPITYRCFLPDLTRFVSVCCAASDQTKPEDSKNTLKREFSPA